MPDALPSLIWVALRYWPPLILLWLAVFFGKTLRAGATPLIERVARRSAQPLPPPLRRYTRWLTRIWCAYFAAAATLMAICIADSPITYGAWSLGVWTGTAVLFIGERLMRPRLFPHEVFPGLLQQLRDTWHVWRARDEPNADLQ